MDTKITDIDNVEPKEVLSWFKQICAIPHGSYHEKAISDWLTLTCKKLGCDFVQQYPSGMIIAKLKATKGLENRPTILLQAHMDMVLAKTSDCSKNLLVDPIDVYYDTNTKCICANKTTLGADNGIGVAVILAIISSKNIIHGPLDICFTTCEEDNPGDCIAKDLKPSDISATNYINLDGLGVHTLVYGSAGCVTAKYDNHVEYISSSSLETLEIVLEGYKSGHSGGEIHKPHINAIVQLAETLLDFANSNNVDIRLVSFNAGPINNVIPVFAKCCIKMDKKFLPLLQNHFAKSVALAKEISQGFEQNITCKINMVSPSSLYALSKTDTNRVLMSLSLCPNKVFTPQKDQKCMFSSSNVGFVQLDKVSSSFKVDFKIRSFVDLDVKRNEQKIHRFMTHFGWANRSLLGLSKSFINDPKNNLTAKIWCDAYQKITNKPLMCDIVPGGLEIAEICAKKPNLTSNAICVAATVLNEHSVKEAVPVKDLQLFWQIIQEVLKTI